MHKQLEVHLEIIITFILRSSTRPSLITEKQKTDDLSTTTSVCVHTHRQQMKITTFMGLLLWTHRVSKVSHGTGAQGTERVVPSHNLNTSEDCRASLPSYRIMNVTSFKRSYNTTEDFTASFLRTRFQTWGEVWMSTDRQTNWGGNTMDMSFPSHILSYSNVSPPGPKS